MSDVSEEESEESYSDESDQEQSPIPVKKTVFNFVGSPVSGEDPDEDPNQSDVDSDNEPPVPLEPEIEVIHPPPQKTPERPAKTPSKKKTPKKKTPKKPPKKTSQGNKKAPPSQGESGGKGNDSAAPPPTPPWPSPPRKEPSQDPPAYIQTILDKLEKLTDRMDGFERNQSGDQNANAPSAKDLDHSRNKPKTPSVVIANPPVTPAPMHLIPEGWRVLHDGMALGKEPGSVVFSDGVLYSAQTIELDMESFERPIWRYRKRHGTSKAPKGKIPVRVAYENFYELFQQDPVGAREWLSSSFKPPGSGSDRALIINLDDDAVMAEFFNKAKDWFRKMAKDEKATWEEALSPANFILENITSVSPEEFVKTFGRKAFSTTDPSRIFNSERIPALPKDAIDEEAGARMNLLASLKVTLEAEALTKQVTHDSPLRPGLLALLKSTLTPLWTAFGVFAQKKLQLRKLAMKEFWSEGQLFLRLLCSDPMSEELFAPDALAHVVAQAEHQAKSLLQILGHKSQGVKRSLPQNQGRQKRQKMSQPRQEGSNQQQNQSGGKFYQKRQNFTVDKDKRQQQQASPKRRYVIPKIKTPKTPRKQQSRSPKGNRKSPGNPRNQNF